MPSLFFTDHLFTCSKCKTAKYCSQKCQRLDWKQNHKKTCRTNIVISGDTLYPKVLTFPHELAIKIFNQKPALSTLSSAYLTMTKKNCVFILFVFESEKFKIFLTVRDIPQDQYKSHVSEFIKESRISGQFLPADDSLLENPPLVICRIFDQELSISNSPEMGNKLFYSVIGEFKTCLWKSNSDGVSGITEAEKEVLKYFNPDFTNMSNNGFLIFGDTTCECTGEKTIQFLVEAEMGETFWCDKSILED